MTDKTHMRRTQYNYCATTAAYAMKTTNVSTNTTVYGQTVMSMSMSISLW